MLLVFGQPKELWKIRQNDPLTPQSVAIFTKLRDFQYKTQKMKQKKSCCWFAVIKMFGDNHYQLSALARLRKEKEAFFLYFFRTLRRAYFKKALRTWQVKKKIVLKNTKKLW